MVARRPLAVMRRSRDPAAAPDSVKAAEGAGNGGWYIVKPECGDSDAEYISARLLAFLEGVGRGPERMTMGMGMVVPNEWERLLTVHYEDIYRFATRFIGNETDAADVTQRTFLRALSSGKNVVPHEEIRPWLFTIARNLCIDEQRWWKRWRVLLHLRANEIASAEDKPAESGEVRRALAALPQRQREVFILRHWHGFSTEETARLLELNAGTVKSHLSRAIERLKRDLLEGGTTEKGS